MTAHCYQIGNQWYWRSVEVNQCGPFETVAEAMANALNLEVPHKAAPPLAAPSSRAGAPLTPRPPGS